MKLNLEFKSHRRLQAWIEAGCDPAKIGAYEKSWLIRISEFVPYMDTEELKGVYKIAPDIKIHHFCSEWLPNSRHETKNGIFVPRSLWGITWSEYAQGEYNNPFLDQIIKYI